MIHFLELSLCILILFQGNEIEKKYANLLEKKWTSVIRLQRKVISSVKSLKSINIVPP